MNKIFAFFRKLCGRLKNRGGVPEHGCWDCKHTNKGFEDAPCCWCDLETNTEWEPKK